MVEKFYFEPGFSLRTIAFGDEVRLLNRFRNLFQVNPVARENWIEFSGEESDCRAAAGAVGALQQLFLLRGKELERPDIEMILKGSAGRKLPDLKNLWESRVSVAPGKKDVLPRSLRQRDYLEAMRHKEVVFGIGPAGTGKTYLAMAMAITAFKNNEVERIILTRPAIEAGEKLGFLPGDLQSKVDPYLRPLYDALYQIMGAESFVKNMEKGLIEVAPLAYMRGRTLDNAFIILDEAQNTTPAQMKMFLTRIGFGSKVVVTGDLSQKDLPAGTVSGLEVATKVLGKIEDIAISKLTNVDVVRHPLVQKIVKAYEEFEEKQNKKQAAKQNTKVKREGKA